MNKKTKSPKLNKLTLNQETLRALTDHDLTAVGGGVDYYSKLSVCGMNTCTRNN